MINLVKEWWVARDTRERVVIAAGLAIVVVTLIVTVLWLPAVQGRARAAREIPLLQEKLVRMEALAQEAKRLAVRASAPAPSGENLKDALAGSLKQHGQGSGQVTLAGRNVHVHLANVPFAVWVAWLDEVRVQYKAQTVEARITSLGNGVVSVDATLTPPVVP